MPDASGSDQSEANKAQKLISRLRGQNENDGFLYRNREHVLGDPVNATPAYAGSHPGLC